VSEFHLSYYILVIWKVDGVGKQEGRELTRERTKRGRLYLLTKRNILSVVIIADAFGNKKPHIMYLI